MRRSTRYARQVDSLSEFEVAPGLTVGVLPGWGLVAAQDGVHIYPPGYAGRITPSFASWIRGVR